MQRNVILLRIKNRTYIIFQRYKIKVCHPVLKLHWYICKMSLHERLHLIKEDPIFHSRVPFNLFKPPARTLHSNNNYDRKGFWIVHHQSSNSLIGVKYSTWPNGMASLYSSLNQIISNFNTYFIALCRLTGKVCIMSIRILTQIFFF